MPPHRKPNPNTRELPRRCCASTTKLRLIYHVPLDADTESELSNHEADADVAPSAAYYRAICAPRVDASMSLLVAGCGAAGGPRGEASALYAWPLTALTPPPLLATTTLPERAAHRRAELRRALEPEPEPEELDEEAVRALCTPPDAVCRLRMRLLGLALHPNERCVWASGAGARLVCASLPALRPLRTLAAPGERPAPQVPVPHYYVQPASRGALVGVPAGDGSGAVWLWSSASGACAPAPLTHAAPALALLLPPVRAHTRTALVLTPDDIYVWTSRASS